ncbi:minor head protein inhibitor of protease [Serratia phage 92A1]|nr:minor head protein inhibitor of protease [Serratia phage 92A1]
MIDQDYIEELRGLEDKKEAKKKLLDYAKESFNLDVKKSKGFDSIIADIEEHIRQYNEEAGIDEPVEGSFSPTDFVDEANELAMKGEELTIPEIKIGSPIMPEVVIETPELKVVERVSEVPHEEQLEKLRESVEKELPEIYDIKDFQPTIVMIGRSPGYYNLPWWIFEWIQRTPDWKKSPKKFEHSSAHDTLLSLIYFIKRDGQIRIRETKHSRFHVLN